MTKLCMIGNSHVAAMRLAWDKVAPQHPEIDAVIYGAHAKNLVTASVAADSSLRCEGPPFWTFKAGDAPNRAREIALRDFDVAVIVGCDFGPSCVFRTYRRYHFSGLKGRRRQSLTRDMFLRAMMQIINESAAMVLARMIRESAGLPVYLVPTPLPAENGYLDREKANMEPYQAALDAGDGDALMSLYKEGCDRLANRGFNVIAQHESTQASPISSLQSYSDNSVRLRADDDMPHPENDYFHMNEDYGAIMWDRVIETVTSGRA